MIAKINVIFCHRTNEKTQHCSLKWFTKKKHLRKTRVLDAITFRARPESRVMLNYSQWLLLKIQTFEIQASNLDVHKKKLRLATRPGREYLRKIEVTNAWSFEIHVLIWTTCQFFFEIFVTLKSPLSPGQPLGLTYPIQTSHGTLRAKVAKVANVQNSFRGNPWWWWLLLLLVKVV